MTSDRIAEVVPHITARDGHGFRFTYRIPPHLHPTLQPGHLVWVPLQQRLVQGIIVQVAQRAESASAAPPERSHPPPLRDIVAVVDPAVCLTPTALRLAAWLAESGGIPHYEALALFLPPGLAQDATIVWRITPAGRAASLGELPERERAVLYYMRKQGDVSEVELRRALHDSNETLRTTCHLLRERGMLTRDVTIAIPRVRPRMVSVVQLRTAPAALPATLEGLQRAPKQQAVVRWLAEQPAAHTAWVETSTLYAATGATRQMLRALEEKGVLVVEQHEVRRDPLAGEHIAPDTPPPLTEVQQRVWQPIVAALEHLVEPAPPDPAARVFLLHGVTGSGKTEIYLRAVARALRLGRQALLLVPEIALTTQLVRRFAARFPAQLAVLHSNLAVGERYDEWRRLRQGEARVAIGSRSAIFAPLPDLGIIILDEEHEPSYKQEEHPRYHARQVALRLGAESGSVVILGSATPSIESYHAARSGCSTLLEMRERVGMVAGADGLVHSRALPMPRVRIVDMRQELQQGNRSIFSQPLQRALAGVLERSEQALLFLNRRGATTFVMCRDCGHVLVCPNCHSSLVIHYHEPAQHERRTAASAASERDRMLVCHSCSYRAVMPAFCSQCLSPRIKSFGVGTQQVEHEVHTLFPHARTLRWDRDSASQRGAHERLFQQFLHHEADVLVGTQMIAKGFDLPLVSLVGVVAADTALHLPDFRSGERTFQLLTQVAGRAGRRSAGAQVVIQSYTPEHYALRAAQEHDYHAFYQHEIAFRRQTGYPPFSRLVRFIYTSKSRATCQRTAHELATQIAAIIEQQHRYGWGIIGPAPSLLRRRGQWRWHLLLRIPTEEYSDQALASLLAALGPIYGWVLDRDPLHVL